MNQIPEHRENMSIKIIYASPIHICCLTHSSAFKLGWLHTSNGYCQKELRERRHHRRCYNVDCSKLACFVSRSKKVMYLLANDQPLIWVTPFDRTSRVRTASICDCREPISKVVGGHVLDIRGTSVASKSHYLRTSRTRIPKVIGVRENLAKGYRVEEICKMFAQFKVR